MSVLRARSACPRCYNETEVWYYKGKLVPTNITECNKCSYAYSSSDFIVSILELRQNVTISTSSTPAILS
jgi:Zn ribbon nucleic-acid-binding protein